MSTDGCLDDVCITCSDQALPARVTRLLDNDFALVDQLDGPAQISVAMVSVAVGDTVLVHAGEAIAVVAAP